MQNLTSHVEDETMENENCVHECMIILKRTKKSLEQILRLI